MSNVLVNVWLACVKVLFTFLHIVCNGLQYFDSTWSLFKRKWEAAVTLNGIDAELYVKRFVTGLDCPSHLAVIVGDDAIDCQSFASLIVWCIAAGISFLTIYDRKGRVLEQEQKIYNCFVEKCKTESKRVIFRNLHTENGRASNGFASKFYVNVISEVDGMNAFVGMAHYFAKENLLVHNSSHAVTQEIISQQMFTQRGLPEPELAIVVSPYMCTYGFPPWDLRLTEFVRIDTLSDINANQFCNILQRYSRCQKRHGK